ncbi:MAG: inositol monophosphatase [Clostridiales bacterium]|nr:inositol monophosphatase [Candidatus Cacconaster stercorequi]
MLEQMIAIVRRAGDMIRDAHNIERDTAEKTCAADLVTKYDIAVQQFLHTELLRLMPEADFLGEEGQHDALTKPWIFVVDPIDGTTNFVRELHYSNIAVALVHEGTVEYGVVYNPFMDELYAAQRGKGATLNGRPIHVSQHDVSHAIIMCGSTIYDRSYTDRSFSLMRQLYDRGLDFRRFGSAELDLCQVAAGRIEIFFECRLSPWDFAAGSLILTEAGGRFSTLEGKPIDPLHPGSVWATNASCHHLLQELIIE